MVACARLVVSTAAAFGVAGALRKGQKGHVSQSEDFIRLVQGGAMSRGGPESAALEAFRGFPAKGVKFISAASPRPSDPSGLYSFLTSFGVNDPEWIPVYESNCANRTRDPKYIKMVEDADAIYIGGGQSGRVSSCLFGSYNQRGINSGEETPMLKALRGKRILGGSSAGAMTQPSSEILITGHSKESYDAVKSGQVYERDAGNGFLGTPQAVDTHFSERGRQGRLLVFAAQTKAEWAFGVDEATAYIWRPSGLYEVVRGAYNGGVVIYQGATGDKSSQRGRMHFLTLGDKIDIKTGAVTYSADKTPCSSEEVPAGSKSVFNGGGSNVYKNISIATAKAPAGTTVANFHGYWSQVQVVMHKDERTVAMCGPSGESFENLLIEQTGSPTRILSGAAEKPNVPEDYIYPEDED